MREVRLLSEDDVETRAVAVVRAEADTQHAFDGVASTYHDANVGNRILCAMRERFWQAVDAHIPVESRLLDLGCGPGTDAEVFAARGYRVTAIDSSAEMVTEARRRVRGAGIDVLHLAIDELDRLAPETFDAACSNFGPLNCVVDVTEAARAIARRLRPGGVLIASVIGRVCPWEIALYLARRDWMRVRVRFAPALTPVPLEQRTVWTQYYWPASFTRIFEAAGFARVSLRTLGLFVPPPYMHAFADRHRAFMSLMQQIEDRVGNWPGVRSCGDHFLIVLRKAGTGERGLGVRD